MMDAASQGSLSTGNYASSVRRVTPVKAGPVVLKPRKESYQKILDVVAERASVHDGQYVAIQRRLKGCTKEMLVDKEVTWHRRCYSYATNQTELQRARARDRFEHSVATGQYAIKRPGNKRSRLEMEADIPGHRSHSQDLQQILCQKCCAFSANWVVASSVTDVRACDVC